MILLSTRLHLRSSHSLEDTATVISHHIFGGIKFVGRNEYIYDEVPAIYGEKSVFGFRIVLQGHGGEEGYILELWSHFEARSDFSTERVETTGIRIGDYVKNLLADVKEIQFVEFVG